MKANKALKRLAKIESLMSVVAERYSVSAPHLRKVLKDAADAVARAKQAVSLQASSGTKAPTAHRATKKAVPAQKNAAPSQKKVAVKKVAANAPLAETAKRSTRVKKTAKKRAARKTAAVPVAQAAMEAVSQ